MEEEGVTRSLVRVLDYLRLVLPKLPELFSESYQTGMVTKSHVIQPKINYISPPVRRTSLYINSELGLSGPKADEGLTIRNSSADRQQKVNCEYNVSLI